MPKYILFLLLLLSPAVLSAEEIAQNAVTIQLQDIYNSYKQDPARSCQKLENTLQSSDASLLNTKDAKKAYQFLGNCRYQEKNLPQAIAAYLKAADLDATDPQPLLDAGSVAVEQGDYSEGETKYREALKRIAGDDVQEKKIRAMISHIPNKLQSNFNVSTSVGYDSNVNSGPEGTIHLLYGIFNYTLDSNDKPRDDFLSYNSAGAALIKALNPKTAILFNANVGNTSYFSENNFNTSTLSASAGYKKTFNDKSVTTSPFINYQTLDGTSYQISRGLNITGAIKASKRINVWPSVNGYVQDFYNDKLRDAVGLSAGSSASYQLTPKTSLIGSLFYSYNDAKNDLYTYNSIFIGSSVNQNLCENLTGTLGYNIQFFNYDAIDPAFGTSRQDVGHTAYVSLDYSLRKVLKTDNAFLNLSVSRNQDNSNQSFYDNHRLFSSAKLTYSF